MFKHLLVPVDGSELSERAIDIGLQLATRLGARVTAYIAEPTVPLPTMSSNMSAFNREVDAHEARTDAHAREVLARFAERAATAGVPFAGDFERVDAVEEGIVRAAERAGCDCIVMATHGRGAFGELLFGSHTKGVMARSALPLLVLR